MLALPGGQLQNHWFGLYAGYKGISKRIQISLKWQHKTSKVHEELNYDWFCHIYMSNIFFI